MCLFQSIKMICSKMNSLFCVYFNKTDMSRLYLLQSLLQILSLFYLNHKTKINPSNSAIIQIKYLDYLPEFGYNQNVSLVIENAQIQVQRSFLLLQHLSSRADAPAVIIDLLNTRYPIKITGPNRSLPEGELVFLDDDVRSLHLWLICVV